MNTMKKILVVISSIAAIAGGSAMPVLAARQGPGAGIGLSADVSAGAGANAGGANIRANAQGPAGPNATGIPGRVQFRVSAALAARIARAKKRADEEVTRRLSALTALETRLSNAIHLPQSIKAELLSSMQARISALTDLQARIGGDAAANASSSLRADIRSILDTYHAFALLHPQAVIVRAAARINRIGGLLSQFAVKLQARISAAEASSTSMGASVTALADMNAKIAAASSSAQAAISEALSIRSSEATSTAAFHAGISDLQGARAKIVAAQHDLDEARHDARTIVVALIKLGGNGNAAQANVNASSPASASTSASTSASSSGY